MDEQAIRGIFSKIKVNPKKTEVFVLENLQTIPPEKPRRTHRRFFAAAAVFAALLVISTSVVAFYGGFELFISRVDPPFADILEPLMNYAEDQDIRVTILGATRFDRTAVLYISVQDISGQNRLSEGSAFFGWLDDVHVSRGIAPLSNWSMGTTPLHFDEFTNTQYFQLTMQTRTDNLDELTFQFNRIVLSQSDFCEERLVFENSYEVHGEWRITVQLEDGVNPITSYFAENEIRLENLYVEIYEILFEFSLIAITPINLEVRGRMSYNRYEMQGVYMQLPPGMYWGNSPGIWHNTMYKPQFMQSTAMHDAFYLEINGEETIGTHGGGSGLFANALGGGPFESNFLFPDTVDLNSITAIIIFGERFPIN
jgi:hypothetical protein